jgi:hypothetical protein
MARTDSYRWYMYCLSIAQQKENDDDQEEQSNAAHRIVSPIAAMPPSRVHSSKQQDQDNQQNKQHPKTPLLVLTRAADSRVARKAVVVGDFRL